MSERPFSPEEFVRLLALPEGHPERRKAESSGMLDAWRRMLKEFEDPPTSIASPAELSSADAALERGMAGVIARQPSGGSGARASGAGGSGFMAWLSSIVSRPAARPAFALAALLIVASASWWMVKERAPRAVRGTEREGGIVVTVRNEAAGVVELSWAPVPGAQRYRVRFFGPTLREVSRTDDIMEPKLRLERDALPPGTTAGEEILVEVAALRGEDVLVVSSPRAVRLP